MKCPSIPDDDPQRLKALCEYALDPGATLSSLSPVVRIASRMFDMPIAAVNIIGSDRVFFAASHGLREGAVDMTRDASFCAHAILTENGMIVRDAERDERFHDNPLGPGRAISVFMRVCRYVPPKDTHWVRCVFWITAPTKTLPLRITLA